jgi:hypothetical protein
VIGAGNDRVRCFRAFLMICVATVVVPAQLSAQASGQLRFRFEPDRGMQYVLDGKYRLTDKEMTLTEGTHRFVFWAPERLMLDTAFTIVPDRTLDVLVRLRYSQDFVDYRKALARYEKQDKWGRYLPPVVMGATAVWATVAIIDLDKSYDELQDLNDAYSASADPGRIDVLKDEALPAAKDELKAARIQAYVASGLFVASTVGTVLIRKHLAKRVPPVFEDKERIRFEGLAYQPGQRGSTWAAVISIPLP